MCVLVRWAEREVLYGGREQERVREREGGGGQRGQVRCFVNISHTLACNRILAVPRALKAHQLLYHSIRTNRVKKNMLHLPDPHWSVKAGRVETKHVPHQTQRKALFIDTGQLSSL